jgi:SAM-dependent methyltransferase/methyltransferase-like protein
MKAHDQGVFAHDGSLEGDYEVLPYPSMPFAYTQPAHLAALAALFGVETAAAERARVLELGCASGGNLVPLAARFPHARFLGVDLSRRHIDDGRRRIAALGISNVEIRQADLTELTWSGEQFDYVICHGVFSWVRKPAQDAIFRICRDTLAPDGVAAISYNVLPGWHLRQIVRDICLYHVSTEGTPQARVAAARRALDLIAQSASDSEPYGLLLRNEAKRIAGLPASYILGEFLAPNNAPCYFHEFVAWAEQWGLSYLCEGALGASISETLFPQTESRLRAVAGTNWLALEQCKDFFSGRPFRRSILTRTGHAPGAATKPTSDRLRTLHVTSRLQTDPAQTTVQASVYKDARGRAVTAKDPAVRNALANLAKAYPASVPVLELLEASAAGSEGLNDAKFGARVCNALFTLIAAGQAGVSAVPQKTGLAMAERPCVWSVARIEAASGQRWVTNLHHDPIALHPVAASLLPHVDGTNDRRKLQSVLANAIQSGAISVPALQDGGLESAGLEALTARQVDQTLNYLAMNALLASSVE